MNNTTEREKLLYQLSKFDDQTLGTALAYAQNLVLYGIDVTERWKTATEQSQALTEAYQRGFYTGIGMAYTGDDITPPQFDPNPDDKFFNCFNKMYAEPLENAIVELKMEVESHVNQN